jgi:ABC-type transporter Mla subunit MlaD
MQKQAPSVGRILVALGFTLSCFGLILFLWIAFGGPIPLRPESYRITAYFPEATQLAIESDVRIGGVSVGKVKSVELAPVGSVPGNEATRAEIEIDPEFAPISSDARAILRQKTLLGETYVELTSGTEPDGTPAPVSLGPGRPPKDSDVSGITTLPDGGHMDVSQVEDAVQIDEIFNALDKQTRDAFQRWQANAAIAINGRGADFNDALGNLGPFVSEATNIVDVLQRQRQALRGLVRDTGTVFQALSERNDQLAGAITGSNDTFEALQANQKALEDTFHVLPVFERETNATLKRLDSFQANTEPLVQKLLPVANDISPTLKSVRELSPQLKSLFTDLGPLVDAAKRGLPSARDFIGGLRPVLDAMDPFLANLNPVVSYLGFYEGELGHFLENPPAALSGTLPAIAGQPAPRHALRQLSYTSAESLSVYPQRLATNRGNGYLSNDIITPRVIDAGIFENFDCDNTGYPGNGEVTGSPPVGVGFAACIIQPDFPGEFGGGHAPQLFADP